MASYNNITTHTRREAFTALGATGLAGVIMAGIARPDPVLATTPKPAPAGDDFALLRLAAELTETDARYASTNEPWSHLIEPAPQAVDDELEALAAHAQELRLRIAGLHALTAAGRAAKARLAMDQIAMVTGGMDLDPHEQVIMSLCRDVVSAGAAA